MSLFKKQTLLLKFMNLKHESPFCLCDFVGIVLLEIVICI